MVALSFFKNTQLLRFSISLIIFLSFLFNFGCKNKKTPIELATQQKILLLGNLSEPTNLDPHFAFGDNDSRILNGLFEPLIILDPKTLRPLPGAAKSWEVSEDKRVYTFHLQDNGKWSNGDPVTAGDFVFSYKRALSPDLGAPLAYMMYPLKNAEKFNKGEIKDFNEVGVRALNSHTLQLTLEYPSTFFLNILSNFVFIPLHPSTLKKFDAESRMNGVWTRPENMVSNGAFKLKEWVVNSYLEIEKNLDYWDSKNVKLKGAKFIPISNITTEERAFQSKQLHITYALPDNKIHTYLKEKNPNFRHYSIFGLYFYVLNTKIKPLDDKRIRQALAYALNRQSITDNILQKSRIPAYTIVPPYEGYNNPKKIQEDIKKAQNLFVEAGYPNGKGFPELEISINTLENHKVIAEAIQEMWKENLNISVTVVNKEWKVFLNDVANHNFQIARNGWLVGYLDAKGFLEVLLPNARSPTGWENNQYIALMGQSDTQIDPQKRIYLMQQAEDIALDEMPFIPIFYYSRIYLVSSDVQNWQSNILDVNNLKFIDLISSH